MLIMRTKWKLFQAIKSYNKIFVLAIFLSVLFCNVTNAAPEILNIELKTSKYMQMNGKVSRLAIGDPQVASVVQLPNSPNEFLIITKSQGSTSLFVWTADGSRYEYLIAVSPEDVGQAVIIQQAIGLPNVHVKKVGDRVLLTGTVRNQYERNWAVQTARLYTGKSSESSLNTGSGIDMAMKTQNSVNSSGVVTTSDVIGDSKLQEQGDVIDLLHMVHPTQIRLEAQIIAIRPQDTKNLGIQYGNDPLNAPGVFAVGETVKTITNVVLDEFGEVVYANERDHRTWTHSDINVSISALVTKNRAKILSRPSITTMSGEEAVIQVGGKIPYTVKSNDGYSTKFEDYGIILQLKPTTDADDRIVTTIHAEVSNMSGETVDGQPILDMRRADSVITGRSGSTMVIGGLMDSSERKVISKFPFLGDIPIIGEFFKYTSKSKDKQELIILVTPYIVDDEDVSQAKMSDSMQEFYNKGQEEKNNMKKVDLNDDKTTPATFTESFK